MAFLQPWILLGWPIIFLPIVIHLLNRRRHRPIEWGAMHFLKQAARVSRGSARIRYWIVLLCRLLAVACVLFVMSRPLSEGWLSFSGTSSRFIVVLDRSPSMEMTNAGFSESKRQVAIAKLDRMLDSFGHRPEVVLFVSPDQPPAVVPSNIKLAEVLETEATDVSAKIPELLGQALRYIETEKLGPTEVWCCSDLQANDWDSSSGLWQSIRESLSKLPFVQLTMLNYADENEPFNVAVRVQNASLRQTTDRNELVLDFSIKQTSGPLQLRRLPVAIRVGETRIPFELELHGRDYSRNGFTIPLDRSIESGAGTIELPDDANAADNSFHFVFAKPPKMKTLVVSDDEEVGSVLRLMAATPSNRQWDVECALRVSSKVSTSDMEAVGLILWQAPMPTGAVSAQLEKHAAQGRAIVFFPSNSNGVQGPSGSEGTPSLDSSENARTLFGTRWSSTRSFESEGKKVKTWRKDTDLLRDTESGEILPVADLIIRQVCITEQKGAPKLALLDDGTAVVSRLASESLKVYFCSTLPTESWSSLGEDGVVLYALIQRAMLEGCRSVGGSQMISAGTEVPSDIADWDRIDQTERAVLSTDRASHSGAYRGQDRIVAINRSAGEDDPTKLDKADCESLLPVQHVRFANDSVSNQRSLVSELWQWFSVGVIVALLAEAIFTMPRPEMTSSAGIPKVVSSRPAIETSMSQQVRSRRSAIR